VSPTPPFYRQFVETQSIKRLYYSISEVSQLVDEEQYVLRYWETEFEQLRPQKNRAGNRIYVEKDVELLRTIKHLLRDKRYTIDGAKEHLRSLSPPLVEPLPEHLEHNSHTLTETFTKPFTETPVDAASGEHLPLVSELRTNGQHSEPALAEMPVEIPVEVPEERIEPIPPPVIPPATSVRELSHEELLQMRDTLRELLDLLDSSQHTSHTA
jgi:DNA-binding transcriptional MerR regulator